MTSPRGPRKPQSSPRLRARRKRQDIPGSRWGDSIRAVRIASGIHETGAKSSRSLKPVRLGGLKPSKPSRRRSSPGTGRVRRSR